MNKIDLTKYSDRELSLTVFNTYELYQHVEAFCEVIKHEDDPKYKRKNIHALKGFAEALNGYKVTRAQWKALYEDIRQYYKENYAGSISR
jgi:hypothetical protein